MGILINFFNGIISIIEYLINEPILLIILILAIFIDKIYPKFRGFTGEFWVKLELNKLPKDEYIVLNNIMLEDELGTHQIDHIVVSKYGIFVIEMKNYYGLIKGEEYKDNWIQYLGKKKFYFKNPIHQNYGHIKSLEKVLNMDYNKFIGIICFSNQAKLKTNTKSIVTQLDYLINSITSFKKVKINSDIKELKKKIISLNITDNTQRKSHVIKIKNKLKENRNKSK